MRARLPVLLMLVCLLTTIAIAQGRGVIFIKVIDEQGAAIPGATITINGPDHRSCLSDERGDCALVGAARNERALAQRVRPARRRARG